MPSTISSNVSAVTSISPNNSGNLSFSKTRE